MCGVVGFLEPRQAKSADDLSATAHRMALALNHRGPDYRDVWIDAEPGVALGHCRLSIIDLSPLGHQPMTSRSGRMVIVYNGEIYNFDELRKELQQEGCEFRGQSDTEVLLEGCERWGVDATLRRLIGMFAFALWDRKTQTLYLARDRLGIKPLYWGQLGDVFVFGSELKGLREHPAWSPKINVSALAGYFRSGYVSAPDSIYEGISKLQPGSFLTSRHGSEPTVSTYWSLAEVARHGSDNRVDLSDHEATDQLETLLGDAVKRRLIADVSLGAFLSGGIDSSAVVALMQANSARPVRTFTIGFNEREYNEARFAKQVATHLKTDHTELYVEPNDARDLIPKLPKIYDEPFADLSQIPTYLLCELTRQHVTVALSGDGGDELFAGYTSYQKAINLHRRIDVLPMWLRHALGAAIRKGSSTAWTNAFRVLPPPVRPLQMGPRLYKLAIMLESDPDALFSILQTIWEPSEILASDRRQALAPGNTQGPPSYIANPLERMQYEDTLSYLPDDILTKVDRASMAVALEARVPILDHRVVEFAWSLPQKYKIRENKTKWLLREVAYRHVPRNLLNRPKMGFAIPLEAWLRGPLRDWSENLLSESRLKETGFLDVHAVRRTWDEHLKGIANWQFRLWPVLMFQAWLDEK